MQGARRPVPRLLAASHLHRVAVQHLHVLPDEGGDLEGLRRGEDHLALFPVAARYYHEAVEGGRVAEDAGVVVGAEGVAGAVLQEVEALLVDG